MINLLTFFKNHFDTNEISDDNLRKFTEDHLSRLNVNNAIAGITPYITATTTVYTAYNQAIIAEETAFAQQQSRTMEMNNAQTNFLVAIRQKEGIVRGNWDVGTSIYQEFFPLGLTEYNNANLSNIETLMTRFLNIATTHEADLGANFITQFTDLKNNFTAARTLQLQKIGSVENLKTATAAARQAVEVQLMSNLFFIASHNIGRPEACNDFFDQSIIRRAQSSDDGTIKDSVAATATKNIESQGITSNSRFKITNTGTVALHFCLSADELGNTDGQLVQVGDTRNFSASDLGEAGNHYLNVHNPSTDTEGFYEVSIF